MQELIELFKEDKENRIKASEMIDDILNKGHPGITDHTQDAKVGKRVLFDKTHQQNQYNHKTQKAEDVKLRIQDKPKKASTDRRVDQASIQTTGHDSTLTTGDDYPWKQKPQFNDMDFNSFDPNLPKKVKQEVDVPTMIKALFPKRDVGISKDQLVAMIINLLTDQNTWESEKETSVKALLNLMIKRNNLRVKRCPI